MGKYLLLMYADARQMTSKPAKHSMESVLKPWRKYLGPLVRAGKCESAASLFFLPGKPSGKMVFGSGTKDLKAEKLDIGGCMIINAKDMPEAVRIAKRSPHAKVTAGPKGFIAIREIKEII